MFETLNLTFPIVIMMQSRIKFTFPLSYLTLPIFCMVAIYLVFTVSLSNNRLYFADFCLQRRNVSCCFFICLLSHKQSCLVFACNLPYLIFIVLRGA